MSISPIDFGESFKSFMSHMMAQAPLKPPFFLQRLTEFFETDPRELPIVRDSIRKHEHPNFQRALDSILAADGRTSELIGFNLPHYHEMATHSDLFMQQVQQAGSVQYKRLPLQDDQIMTCIDRGLILLSSRSGPAAILISAGTQPHNENIAIAVMAPVRESADALLAELRAAMHSSNVYRGRIVSLAMNRYGQMEVQFHRLQNIVRNQIILPPGLLDRIEALTINFSPKAERLRQAGRHLKRGILLHGVPGTGKTLTAMYLAGAMQGRTVLLLTGRGLGMLEMCCDMARLLEPSTLILEDVDLIAEDRTQNQRCGHPLLFELLNQMDGLGEDMDVLFLLTTNRPDILEPALAARPGRIDQAFEIPLPDRDGRNQLLKLYGKGLEMQISDWDRLITRTEGASGAFIRELLRKAAVFAADRPGPLTVTEGNIDSALHEMLIEGGPLTRSLLGYREASGE